MSFVHANNYKTLQNSLVGGYQIRLPGSFAETRNGYAIGDFFKDRNALSKQNGLDFSSYLGRTLTLFSCDGERKQAYDSELTEAVGGPNTETIIGLYDGDKLIAFWTSAASGGTDGKANDWSILKENLSVN